jgi:23S rRNA (cytosine1962-C5)-methyltransferase
MVPHKNMRTWQLRKGAERRARSGHPWVFSNELSASPKGATPGEDIVLLDGDGKFIAYGYGNPKSLISFRALSYDAERLIDQDLITDKILQALKLRDQSGLKGFSSRLVFAENDFLPGLIVDRYFLPPRSQAFVIQSSTVGMDRLLPFVLKALETLVDVEKSCSWEDTALISASTSKSRILEGLLVEPKQVLKPVPNLGVVTGRFQSAALPTSDVLMDFDIINGQKTGFFLDQRENIRLLIEILKTRSFSSPLRILDLCCYVGQWSTQVAAWAKSQGLQAECTLYDSSQEALNLATKNVQRYGAQAIAIKGDVVNSLRGTLDKHYDIVICDPPAFIKKKKDVPTGKAAYGKLNRESLKKVRDDGIYVSCSCSGLFTAEEFREMLGRVSFSSYHTVHWVKQGFHSPDHPQRMEFPEGSYLKCLMGIRSTT